MTWLQKELGNRYYIQPSSLSKIASVVLGYCVLVYVMPVNLCLTSSDTPYPNLEQRQHRCDEARLTESGSTRSEQLLVMPIEQLTDKNDCQENT